MKLIEEIREQLEREHEENMTALKRLEKVLCGAESTMQRIHELTKEHDRFLDANRTPRQEKASPPPRRPNRPVTFGKPGGVSSAVREVAAGWAPEFKAAEMEQELATKFPKLVVKPGTVSVTLLDMANRGELTRRKEGKAAFYKRAQLRAPAAAEKSPKEIEYQKFREGIAVPAESTIE